ncbi:CheR family methyltransferase [Actinophytocola algeriensis]|uniref:protein-glutamate O-methyltransferase n=1 Tax=Actinophytocola algeriensis TaxID=1768010 RepID=A0A7W7VE82_9PSEU|nr:CheR family methyltransferase [Actinophytocola algeriensis]MBB4906854.1 two-component system CheB/CheR fusion protein [Actinophytocola algeriensis]MBE1478335.1 two-component system CheB/CheR fusion protein [Actinophytocola algeriensis]
MTEPIDSDLEELLSFIRDSRGFDFTGYKRTSLTRRIRKRMADVGISDYVDYRDLLEASAAEFGALFNTILINVTSFFRDDESWAYLRDDVVPELLGGLTADEEIRVWSAGCSSGEEAYSLAIVLAEAIGIDEFVRRVKIYSTDVDDDALRKARAGAYEAKAVEALPEPLREKYFEPQDRKLVFRSDLRRRVIFGRHDITRDAPISRLHLLVCRNTLMYFNVEAQQTIVDRFTFALNDRGVLFLGKAEMLLADGNRFDVVTMRHRIFQRRGGGHAWPSSQERPMRTVVTPQDADRQRQLGDLALETAPNALVAVDMAGTVMRINGQARERLGLGPADVGRPFRDLEVSYRPLELRSLVEQAQDTRRPIRVNAVERRLTADDVQYLDIVVQPLIASDGEVLGAALSFIDNTLFTQLQQEVKRSREELETTNEELQSTNEELETTNEELQSSIEELETTNEELQSTNEELETTNEELQSGNEELETMNEEMRIRSMQLDEARTFLEGVLASVAAGVVVLDAELRVRSWNRGAEELWGLRAAEVRHEDFFALDFGLPTADVAKLVRRCSVERRRAGPIDVQAVNRRGRGFTCSLTFTPLEGVSAGVVLLMEAVDQG